MKRCIAMLVTLGFEKRAGDTHLPSRNTGRPLLPPTSGTNPLVRTPPPSSMWLQFGCSEADLR